MKKLIIYTLVFCGTVGMALGQQGNVVQHASPSLGAPAQTLPTAPASGGSQATTAAQLGGQAREASPSPNANGTHSITAPSLVPQRSTAEEEDAKDGK